MVNSYSNFLLASNLKEKTFVMISHAMHFNCMFSNSMQLPHLPLLLPNTPLMQYHSDQNIAKEYNKSLSCDWIYQLMTEWCSDYVMILRINEIFGQSFEFWVTERDLFSYNISVFVPICMFWLWSSDYILELNVQLVNIESIANCSVYSLRWVRSHCTV